MGIVPEYEGFVKWMRYSYVLAQFLLIISYIYRSGKGGKRKSSKFNVTLFIR